MTKERSLVSISEIKKFYDKEALIKLLEDGEFRYKIFSPLFSNLYENKIIYCERQVLFLISVEDLVIDEKRFSATAMKIQLIYDGRLNKVGRITELSKWKFGCIWNILSFSYDNETFSAPYAGWRIWIDPILVRNVEVLLKENKIEEILALTTMKGRDNTTKIQYLGRGIHDEKFLDSLTNSNLKEMLSFINQYNLSKENIDKERYLDVQIRNNYINIYYNGGRIVKVNSQNSIEFDEKYFKLKKAELFLDEIELKQRKVSLIAEFKKYDYQNYFAKAIEVMDKWFKENPNPERQEQHLIAISNRNYGESDYIVIDIEYQVSTLSDFVCSYIPEGKKNPKKPKFDIIAINREGQICVIELKKGADALSGNSGLKEHWDCYRSSIKKNWKPFIEEIKRVLVQKQEFNLLDKNLWIKDIEPEFMFAYAYTDKSTKEEQDRLFKHHYDKIGELIKVIKLQNNTYKLID